MAGGGGWVVISEQGRIEQPLPLPMHMLPPRPLPLPLPSPLPRSGALITETLAIMQGPSVCVLILQQAAFLAAEWEVAIQRKSAGGKINEISICVMLFGRHPSCEHVE